MPRTHLKCCQLKTISDETRIQMSQNLCKQQYRLQIYIYYSWMHHWPIRPQQMSQTRGDISSKSRAHFRIGIQLFRICNTYYIFIGEYCISSDRSPWLELETWLVFETQLLLEEIRYTILNILNAGISMRKCTWLLLLLLPHDCDIF